MDEVKVLSETTTNSASLDTALRCAILRHGRSMMRIALGIKVLPAPGGLRRSPELFARGFPGIASREGTWTRNSNALVSTWFGEIDGGETLREAS